MLINWFTVVAQIVNFLILVFLLKRFLYKPIVKHMNEREERIATRLQEAKDKRAEAQRQIDEFRDKQEEMEQQSRQKLEEAEREAQRQREELLEQARDQVQGKRQSWLQSLEKEKEDFARGLKKRSAQEILRFVQRVLQDLADEPLNNRLAEVLLARMKKLDDEVRQRLSGAAEQGEIQVRSTFELDASMKDKITTALREFCEKDAEVAYQVDHEQPLGVEANAGSVKFSWSIAGYLDELESQVLTLFEEKSRRKDDESGDQDNSVENDERQRHENE
jgi:F-type H+-transporting ATPase subunit b